MLLINLLFKISDVFLSLFEDKETAHFCPNKKRGVVLCRKLAGTISVTEGLGGEVRFERSGLFGEME